MKFIFHTPMPFTQFCDEYPDLYAPDLDRENAYHVFCVDCEEIARQEFLEEEHRRAEEEEAELEFSIDPQSRPLSSAPGPYHDDWDWEPDEGRELTPEDIYPGY